MQLDDNQRQALRQLARQAVGRVSERAHFVLMRNQGMTQEQIAQAMDYSVRTVQRWLNRYDQHGLDGLEDAPKPGRAKIAPHLNDIIETQAGQPPSVYGYLQTVWTVALLALHLLERFGVKVSPSTVRNALHRMRFSWHRPKLTPARKHDPDRAIKEARLVEVLQWPASAATIIAADECDVHLLAVLRAMRHVPVGWQRIGEQLRLPTPGHNQRRSVFGGLNLRTGQWHYLLADHKRTADFMAFLTVLLQAYTTGSIFVIVDNATIHSSQTLMIWLAQQPRLQLVYLPTYSGHRLNPVEKVWWQLKRFIAANRNFSSLAQLDAAIHRCLRSFTPAALLALTNCDVSRKAQAALLAI
jgi:putative transposase